MNRSMYMTDQWFDPDTLEFQQSRLRELNGMFRKALCMYFEELA